MTDTSSLAKSRRWAVAAVGALAAGVLVAPVPAGAGTDSVRDARGRVAALSEEIDAASSQYFEVLATVEQTRADIERLEQEIAAADAEAAALDQVVEARAVEAYTGGGGGELALVIDTSGPLESSRAAYLLEQANAEDNAAIDELAALNEAREDQRAALADAEEQQAAALESLEEEQQALDARLAQALSELDSAIASRAAARLAAQQAAQAAADAAAADAADAAPAPSPEPADPPADYTPTPGQHPQHNHPFLVCTRDIESSGNYRVVSPDGQYHGAYQFLQSTWNYTAAHAGRPGLIGVPPETASEYDQDDMAWTLYQWEGTAPWNGRCG